jgi:hypothetical protein
MTDAKRPLNHCDGHQVLEFKSTLSMTMLGANLLGVIVIAAMVGWSLAKAIPEMEERLSSKISPIIERVAKLEQRMENMENRVK